ncbi:MAG: hypothetical protein ONA90_08560, partial [candidate division KSB1 bacterium]|nr:hypothetical protein [candidate division KSB1 bacterium]
ALAECCAESQLEADLYRIKGDLLVQKSKTGELAPQLVSEAESCFLQAINIARGQEAKSLELRAAVSLASLWQEQNKKEQAHNLVTEIYAWFTEGFETIDLQIAKKLLEQLS